MFFSATNKRITRETRDATTTTIIWKKNKRGTNREREEEIEHKARQNQGERERDEIEKRHD